METGELVTETVSSSLPYSYKKNNMDSGELIVPYKKNNMDTGELVVPYKKNNMDTGELIVPYKTNNMDSGDLMTPYKKNNMETGELVAESVTSSNTQYEDAQMTDIHELKPQVEISGSAEANTQRAFLCVVCADLASGYHYGVPSCEGCKAFFKRSLQSKEINYKCPASSNCTIDKMSRKCCQACRLRKCQDVGMSKEFLGNKIKRPKPDKDTVKQRSKKNDRLSESDNIVESSTNAQEMELESMIQNLTTLHNEMCLKPDDRLEDSETLIKKFCATVDQQLVRIIDWAKQLPGYCNLSISDQAILLQAAWVDLLVLNWVYHSLAATEKIRLSTVFSITFQDAKNFGFEEIYSYLNSLVNRAKKYNIEVEEISCLKAINLTNAESSQLTTPDKVNELITKFTSALQYYSSNRSRESPQKFAKLVLILPQLKYLVNQVIELLTTMKMNHQDKCALSDLVIEMLEAKQRL